MPGAYSIPAFIDIVAIISAPLAIITILPTQLQPFMPSAQHTSRTHSHATAHSLSISPDPTTASQPIPTCQHTILPIPPPYCHIATATHHHAS